MIQFKHGMSQRQLAQIWYENPEWENRGPQWWRLLFKYAEK